MTDEKKEKKYKPSKLFEAYTEEHGDETMCPTVEYLMSIGYTIDEANQIIAEWRLTHP